MKRKGGRIRNSRNMRIARRKKAWEKRESFNKRRITARISLVLTALAVTYLLVYLLVGFFRSRGYPLKDIRFEGAGHLDRSELSEIAGISSDTNLLAMDLKKMKKSLLTDPFIKEAEVSRNFCTGTVTVKVNLRKAVALINCDGIYGIDPDGVVIGAIDRLPRSDLPLISGLDVRGVRAGEKLEERKVKLALGILDYIPSSDLDSLAPLSEVNVSKLGNIVLYVGKEGMEIRLGKDNFNKKIDKAAMILADRKSEGKKTRSIDFRFWDKDVPSRKNIYVK